MENTTRNRVLMPILMPLGILVAIGAFVGLFAYIMLYNTRLGAVALAIVMAAGILAAMSLASSKDTLGPQEKAGVAIAGIVPIAFGLILAFTGGGVDDEALLNINAEPHGPTFDSLEPGHGTTVRSTPDVGLVFNETQVTLPAEGLVGIRYDNQQQVLHNLKVFGSEADYDADAAGYIAATPDFQAGVADVLWTAPGPGTGYYICTIHGKAMSGSISYVEGATATAA